ncbi:hypothetical protein ZIOFF_056913 [Zingiber officinale]|uniref:Trehalose 6-phosphate phosphatase n=1 Tax=Zingiber officinale TaxID=94328 RepID=A0A8J5FH68_ZINOF|nr:hypothetical protein ZIOFF_056913 [Zingiber officinale]
MTKQNVAPAEAVAAIAVASSPPLFAYTPPLSVRKKCLPQIELDGGKAVSWWLDSMRASSPTRAKSAAATGPLVDAVFNDLSDLRMRHPSALSNFDQIASASNGKQIVMFLDYDGTLSPIVDDPDSAFMTNAMRKAVREAARNFPTAIVSGRRLDKVINFVQLAELYYAGSHGMDIKGPEKSRHAKSKDAKGVLFQPASEFLPMIDTVYRTLLDRTKSTPGAKVENNKFCASVHFRCVDEKNWGTLFEQVKSVLKGYPKLRLTQGRKVLEIRPTIKWDKGKALEFLLESLGFANCRNVMPIYIGDDRTDEDAFKVLEESGQGIGILVSKFPKETNATYYLQEPSEASAMTDEPSLVKDFLVRLVEWKRRQTKAVSKV